MGTKQESDAGHSEFPWGGSVWGSGRTAGEAHLNRCFEYLSFDSKRWSVLCIADTGLSPLAGSPGAVIAMLVPAPAVNNENPIS